MYPPRGIGHERIIPTPFRGSYAGKYFNKGLRTRLILRKNFQLLYIYQRLSAVLEDKIITPHPTDAGKQDPIDRDFRTESRPVRFSDPNRVLFAP